jgi:NADPH-dependent 2,4-dienoyl-CoA reductase/sulfur reductase-like enzyme
MPDVVVAGAGQAGLIVACILAERGCSTVVVDRLPAAGGQDHGRPERSLLAAASAANVQFHLGSLGIGWDGDALATLGVEGARRIACKALVVATGTRPATRGELGIDGDRCAGILPASAAVHLTESGVLPGHHPVVFGTGTVAGHAAEVVASAGAKSVRIVCPCAWPQARLPAHAGLYEHSSVVSARGVGRISAIWIQTDDRTQRVATDALILAERRVPMKNIEGAIRSSERVIDCHSRAEVKSLDDARQTAEAAAERVLAVIGREVGAPVNHATRRSGSWRFNLRSARSH